MERERCPRAGARHLRFRAAWASCLPALRPARRRARCIAGLGQAGAGNARGAARGLRPPVGAGFEDQTLRPSRRKHGLTLSLGDEHSLWREPRWNAERRALPLERCRAPSPSPASGRGQEETARRMDYASLGVPLPFIAGSEPERTSSGAWLRNRLYGWLCICLPKHDRAKSRSHRRFRRDAMVLGE